MTSPGETFVVELGRAAARGRRLIRNLQRADKDDILAAAVLWCWENRDTYTGDMPLDIWFATSVKRALRVWRNGEIHAASVYMADIPVPNETEARAAVDSAARELARLITPEQRRIAILQAKGYTAREIMEKLNVDIDKVRSTRSVLRKLQELIPDAYQVTKVLRAELKQPSDDKPSTFVKPTIDQELERLDRPDLGNAPGFADDYVPHKRMYVPWEDIRGTRPRPYGGTLTILDYEEDGDARRLLLQYGEDAPIWVTPRYWVT